MLCKVSRSSNALGNWKLMVTIVYLYCRKGMFSLFILIKGSIGPVMYPTSLGEVSGSAHNN